MRALLVRVGADQSAGGGNWNGPVESKSGRFVYVPIPESQPTRDGHGRPYNELSNSLARFQKSLPLHLAHRGMHLDPDFEHLTYGDQGRRAEQIRGLKNGDFIVFYSGLRDVDASKDRLIYALIGVLKIEILRNATEIPERKWHQNAHTRRVLLPGASDLVVIGCPQNSGRFSTCVPIGEYRDKAYRVRNEILEAWGGLSNKDGYLQRSAILPEFRDAERFLKWLSLQSAQLEEANW